MKYLKFLVKSYQLSFKPQLQLSARRRLSSLRLESYFGPRRVTGFGTLVHGPKLFLGFGSNRIQSAPRPQTNTVSTIRRSHLMGWSDKVGELAPGKFADMFAVSGDPLQDITTLEHAKFVMKGAAIVRNEFAPSR